MGIRSAMSRAVAIAAGFLVLLGTASPTEGASRNDTSPTTRNALAGAGVFSSYHAETGRLRFLGSSARKPIARPTGISASSSPAAAARAFLAEQGGAFGIRNQAQELEVESAREGRAGNSFVRFQQTFEGVPVVGGELVVNLDPEKNVISASGEVVPSPSLSVAPEVSSAAAAEAARNAVAKATGVPASSLRESEPSLWIYDSRIMGGPGLDRPTLVWRMDVTGDQSDGYVDQFVLVDAKLGSVALRFDQLAKAKVRRICDAGNTSSKVPCSSPYERIEGGGASSIGDVNDAYDLLGQTYDFYSSYLSRDSIDGAGMVLYSTTRYCDPNQPCPYTNAFWNGSQMVFGQGYASADDVVAHELTHGVTDYESRLFYYYQSGAINESLSDVFGEFVDQTYDLKGTDSPGTKWLLGEDLPIGALRDMENPPAYGDPDRMTSPLYWADPNENDGGGVHSNSGVNNKAAFLMTDGGTFNGQTVTGLGLAKVARIYHEANTTLLTSASDYADLYDALQQACANLIGTGGITSGNCAEVTDALLAVEMDQTPTNAPNPEAPVCGAAPTSVWSDDLENTVSGNWTRITGSGTNEWYYPQTSNPYSFDATYATSGSYNFWGYDRGSVSDYSMAMTGDVAIPSIAGRKPYLRFNHAFGFEDGTYSTYDGGVVEYSLNGGGSWSDAGSLFTDNGYNATVSSGWGNPLGGRSAFGRESNGYISSRANLSSLAGEDVRFRFRIGTDSINTDYGWFVDDVSIYTCANEAPIADAGGPYSISEGQPLQLNGSGSSDPDGDSMTYAWDLDGDLDFDDGLNGPSPTVSSSTLRALALGDGPATRPVRIRARDLPGSTHDDSAPLTVNNVAPSAAITGPSSIGTGDSGTWVFSAIDPSSIDQAGAFHYEIDWNGDSSVDQFFTADSSEAVTHIFSTAGSRIITATVVDKDGGRSAMSTRGVVVATQPATTQPGGDKGRISSAKLSKRVFAAALARKVKLTVRFSPPSERFNYLLQVKKGKKWAKVKALNKRGSFSARTMTVRSIFAGKSVRAGAYRLKLSADANSRTVSFRVT